MDELKTCAVKLIDANALKRNIERKYMPSDTISVGMLYDLISIAPEVNLRPAPENKPLSLEELRQMGGKPVWTVTLGIDNVYGCELIGEFSDGPEHREIISMCNLMDGTYDVFADLYGKTWLAYARKPELEEK